MFLSYVQMHEEKRSSRASEREHFSDAAADDGGRGRKIFRSHLGISVIKLTPKEKAGRKAGREALLLRVLFPSHRVRPSSLR